MVVQQEQGVDVQAGEDQDARDALQQTLAEKYEAGEGLRERQMMEDEATGTVQDKYTQIYIPVRGRDGAKGVLRRFAVKRDGWSRCSGKLSEACHSA